MSQSGHRAIGASGDLKARSLNFHHPMARPPDDPIALPASPKQRPKPVGGVAVNGIGAAIVEGAPEQQLAAAIAVGIDRVDQFHARSDVEMPRIRLREKYFPYLALED